MLPAATSHHSDHRLVVCDLRLRGARPQPPRHNSDHAHDSFPSRARDQPPAGQWGGRGVHGSYKWGAATSPLHHATFHISGQLVQAPAGGDPITTTLMLMYADDMVLIAASRQALGTALLSWWFQW